jgi:hypothetical protein
VAAAIGNAPESPRLYRDAIGWPSEFATHGSPQRLEELVRWERDTLAGRYGLLDRIGQVSINETAGSADYESIRKWLLIGDPFSAVIFHPYNLERLGVRFALLDADHRLSYAARIADHLPLQSPALWQLKQPGSRIQTPDDARVHVLAPSQSHATLFGAVLTMDAPRRASEWIRVEGDLALHDQPQLVQSGNPPTATIIAEAPHRVTIRARLPRWNLVVLNDRYAAGWKAMVTSSTAEGISSRETTTYRTNSVFRGVYLPAGEHTIEFRYEPPAFYRGAWLSAVSWAALFVGLGVWQWRRR